MICRRLALCACWLAALLPAAARADEWVPPPPGFYSDDLKYFLRMSETRLSLHRVLWLPGKHARETYPYKPPKVGPAIWNVAAPSPGLPRQVFITRDLSHVVLLDKYAELGYGETFTFLGSRGNLLAEYKLDQVLPSGEIEAAERSSNSIWWSPGTVTFLADRETKFAMFLRSGRLLFFDLATGHMLDPTSNDRARLQRQALARTLAATRVSDPRIRVVSIYELGTLRDRAALPRLREVLRKPLVGLRMRDWPDYDPKWYVDDVRRTARASIADIEAGPPPTVTPETAGLLLVLAVPACAALILVWRIVAHRMTYREAGVE